MTSKESSKLRRDEIDPEHSTDETQSCCQNDRHEEPIDAVHDDAQDSPGKMLIQSVSDILSQSAQSVKAFVSGNATTPKPSDGNNPSTAITLSYHFQYTVLINASSFRQSKPLDNCIRERSAESGEEKTLLQSVGEKIMQSAQSVKDAVSGNCDENEEKTLVESVGERITQSAQSVKEAITGTTGENENGEEKTVLQAVGEKIVQSAITVKDAVKGDVHIIPGDDETAELSILVHTILD